MTFYEIILCSKHPLLRTTTKFKETLKRYEQSLRLYLKDENSPILERKIALYNDRLWLWSYVSGYGVYLQDNTGKVYEASNLYIERAWNV